MTTVDSFEFAGVRYFRFGYSPLGKPMLSVYVYYVDGLLIDTGQRNAMKYVLETLASLHVDQIFLTHHHEDHSGNIHALTDLFACPAYASSLCCKLMKSPPPISLPQRAIWGDRPSFQRLTPEDDQIQTKHHTFQMIPIPGHAADMVALYEPEKKWLFSADLYVNSYIGYFLRNERIRQQIESIRRVLELDFEVLFCHHNPKLSRGREQLEKKLRYLQDFYAQVIDWHQKGHSPEEIFRAMKLQEHGWVSRLSCGALSKINMVTSAVRDFEEGLVSAAS